MNMLRLAIVFLTASLTFASGYANASDFSHIDPTKKISRPVLKRALDYLKKNSAQFHNQSYMAIIDYTIHASKPRFFVIDLKTGKVESYLTAHGKGSDPKKTGWAVRFSNRSGTHASSVGFFRAKGTYKGKNGLSLRLEGLSKTNSNADERAVVVHAANYVNEKTKTAGRSWGCPAVDRRVLKRIIDRLDGGSLVYAYGGENPKMF